MAIKWVGGHVNTREPRKCLALSRCLTTVEGMGGYYWARAARMWGDPGSGLFLGPSPSAPVWLCQGPPEPGHNLGKGFRTRQGVEFLDLVVGHTFLGVVHFVFWLLQGALE